MFHGRNFHTLRLPKLTGRMLPSRKASATRSCCATFERQFDPRCQRAAPPPHNRRSGNGRGRRCRVARPLSSWPKNRLLPHSCHPEVVHGDYDKNGPPPNQIQNARVAGGQGCIKLAQSRWGQLVPSMTGRDCRDRLSPPRSRKLSSLSLMQRCGLWMAGGFHLPGRQIIRSDLPTTCTRLLHDILEPLRPPGPD